MKAKKISFTFFLVVVGLLIWVFNGDVNAEEPQKSYRMSRLQSLESLEVMGKIPQVPGDFKCYIAEPERSSENYGLMPSMYSYPVTQPIVRDTELPAVWDWRDHNGVSPVGDQGSTGSCWVWGALKGFEANVLVKTGVYYDLAERTIFNCAAWGNDFPAADRGGLAVMVAHWLSTKGATLESCDPWGSPWNQCLYDQCTPVLGSYGWTRLPADVDTIKSYLYRYGPIQTSMYASWTQFYNYNGTYCLYRANCTGTNHSVQIVGWDDNMEYALGRGAWICQNSWGTNWGDNGYFYIAYDMRYSACIGKTAGFYASHHSWPLPHMSGTLYHYDEVGPSTWVTDPASPDPTKYYGAVVFEAQNWGILRYIETWIPDGNTGVETWVYRRFNTGTSNGPVRVLRHQPETLLATGGFKRLRIPSRLLFLRPGDSFVVVTKVDCDTYQYPLPIEYCFDGTGCTFETGKCWESVDGQQGSWYDSGTWEYDLSIRAQSYDLRFMDIKIDPQEKIVIIGHEYEINWEYPYLEAISMAKTNNELLTIEIVDYDDIDTVFATLASKLSPKEKSFTWKVDNILAATTVAKEPHCCVRITNGRVIGLSEPFYIRKQ